MKKVVKNLKKYNSYSELQNKLRANKQYVLLEKEMAPEYELARSLIRTRLKNNISQKELAQKIGTKQPVISRIESMQSIPTVNMLRKIAAALDAKLNISLR